jgi:hypothetical protein
VGAYLLEIISNNNIPCNLKCLALKVSMKFSRVGMIKDEIREKIS